VHSGILYARSGSGENHPAGLTKKQAKKPLSPVQTMGTTSGKQRQLAITGSIAYFCQVGANSAPKK
ncbi:MAG: hypothetical protein LBO64_02275, partial [Desulfovibrio sp.]|nr:hypothetical protein [Desulfovibrio sp.]